MSIEFKMPWEEESEADELAGSQLSSEIWQWNKERGFTEFNGLLECGMLTEEFFEMLEATTVEDALHEYADFLFVASGTVGKGLTQAYKEGILYKQEEELRGNKTYVAVCTATDLFLEMRASAQKWLDERFNLTADILARGVLLEVLRAVLEANKKKPIGVTDARGKGVKGSEYESPKRAIKEIVQAFRDHDAL